MGRGPSRLTVKYGYRTLGLLIFLLIFSTFLLYEYFAGKERMPLFLALAVIFYIITLVLFVGFSYTVVTRIEKKYYRVDDLVGQTGKVFKGVKAGERGTVNVRNEDWTFVCDSDTSDEQIVTVKRVMEDRVTLVVEAQ
ncbi:MAG: hypothetical protein M1290_00510 [Candidatus Thermoplasmatota archaeon]|jgi:membrane protein implicated in regulation of membrane protease activity|nr:hypothetical protein [Candidatus Thermoplasmatota archaeon]MCL5788933.1 hypothetical protein [Candidatus Thermoplasmatota archaeon]